jgi:hypothetical protein
MPGYPMPGNPYMQPPYHAPMPGQPTGQPDSNPLMERVPPAIDEPNSKRQRVGEQGAGGAEGDWGAQHSVCLSATGRLMLLKEVALL